MEKYKSLYERCCKKSYRLPGNISVLFCTLLFIILALAGLLIDGGIMIQHKIQLEAATEAAGASTIQAYNVDEWENNHVLIIDEEAAKVYANQYLTYNMPEARIIELTVNELKPSEVLIISEVEVEMSFMKIFGIDTKKIRSTIRAKGG